MFIEVLIRVIKQLHLLICQPIWLTLLLLEPFLMPMGEYLMIILVLSIIQTKITDYNSLITQKRKIHLLMFEITAGPYQNILTLELTTYSIHNNSFQG